VLKTIGEDIILGSDFLTNNHVTIDYSKQLVSIDGHEIEMQAEHSIDYHSPDTNLSTKAKILNIHEKSKLNELSEFINICKKGNPILGLFQDDKHTISLKVSTPIQSNGYPIPQKLRDKTMQELKKLLEQGVIRESN
jgi:hypothetical protein